MSNKPQLIFMSKTLRPTTIQYSKLLHKLILRMRLQKLHPSVSLKLLIMDSKQMLSWRKITQLKLLLLMLLLDTQKLIFLPFLKILIFKPSKYRSNPSTVISSKGILFKVYKFSNLKVERSILSLDTNTSTSLCIGIQF